jgi:hypothetical protein
MVSGRVVEYSIWNAQYTVPLTAVSDFMPASIFEEILRILLSFVAKWPDLVFLTSSSIERAKASLQSRTQDSVVLGCSQALNVGD